MTPVPGSSNSSHPSKASSSPQHLPRLACRGRNAGTPNNDRSGPVSAVPAASPATAPEAHDSDVSTVDVVRRWLAQRVHPVFLIQTIRDLAARDLTEARLPVTDVAENSGHDSRNSEGGLLSQEEYWELLQDQLVLVLSSPDSLLAETPHEVVFSLPRDYIKAVSKGLVKMLESEKIALAESISEFYAELCFAPPPIIKDSAPPTSSVSIVAYPVFPRSGNSNTQASSILISETPNVISANGSTGHRTWEAALALCDYILTAQQAAALCSTVIEVGAGTGLVGLVAASHFGPTSLILTDGDAEIVAGLQQTIDRNMATLQRLEGGTAAAPSHAQLTARAMKLYWGDDSDFSALVQATPPNAPALILAADVTYDAAAAPALIATFARLISYYGPQRTRVLLAATIRSEETFGAFVGECCAQHLEMKLIKEYPNPIKSAYFFFPPSSPDIRIYSIEKK